MRAEIRLTEGITIKTAAMADEVSDALSKALQGPAILTLQNDRGTAVGLNPHHVIYVEPIPR